MTNIDAHKTISHIKKRNGTQVSFNERKISDAIFNALESPSSEDKKLANELGGKVVTKLIELGFDHSRIPTVEDVQDIVQLTLIENNHSDVASDYITFRLERRTYRESNILKNPELTTRHKEILKELYLLSRINGVFICFNNPKKEIYELEKMEYLIINENLMGGLCISLNLNKSNKINQLLSPKRILSL